MKFDALVKAKPSSTQKKKGKAPRRAPAAAAGGDGGGAGGNGDGGGGGVPVFVTPASLVTFPVASAVVTIIWKVLGVLVEGWGNSNLVAVIIAFIIGLFIGGISISGESDSQKKWIGWGIAILNCFFLAAAALGIDAGIANAGVAGPQ